jgi:predicted membrane protein
VESWIGDIKVKLPHDLAVRARGRVAFVGDMELLGVHRSGFFLDTTASSQDYDAAPRRLLVDASILIGDVRVSRVG